MRKTLTLLALLLATTPAFADDLYVVTRQQAEEAIGQAIAQERGVDSVKAMIQGTAKRELVTHDKPVTVEIAALSVDDNHQRWRADLKCSDEARELITLPVSGRYQQAQGVPVLKDRVAAGETITEDMIAYADVPQNRIRKNDVTDVSELVGKQAKRTLAPNRPVSTNDVHGEVAVRKGEVVRMIYHSDNLDIRTLGEAMADAGVGDAVRVRNQESKAVIEAVVAGKGEVQVTSLTQ